MEAIALYLTIVSGYLIVAYSAGSKIPNFLSAMVTSLFLSFSLIFVLGSYTFFGGAHTFSRIFGPELQYPTIPVWYAWLVATTEILGIIGCLIYMYQVRKK
jgi:hypothetical protein